MFIGILFESHKIDWVLEHGHKYEFDAHAWLEGHATYYSQRIKDFMLQQSNLDPNKYHIMTWMTDTFKPTPTLHEIKP